MQDEANIQITSEIWVAAYRKLLERQGIPIFINRTGDKTAGVILVKVSKMDGLASLYHNVLQLTGQREWSEYCSDTEERINQIIKKQCLFDQDVWILEIEDPKGRHFLDDFSLLR